MNWMLVSYSAVIISVQLVSNTHALIWASGTASFNLYLCSTRSGDNEPEREKGTGQNVGVSKLVLPAALVGLLSRVRVEWR